MRPSHGQNMEQSTLTASEKKRRLDLDTLAGCDSDDCEVSEDSERHHHGCSKKTTTEAAVRGAADCASIGTNSQWLFSRNDDPQVLLRDNLGDTAAMVESLTHDVSSWCLSKNLSSSSPHGTKSGTAYKQKCRQARREVMRSMMRKNAKMSQ